MEFYRLFTSKVMANNTGALTTVRASAEMANTHKLWKMHGFEEACVPNGETRPRETRAAIVRRWFEPCPALLQVEGEGQYAKVTGIMQSGGVWFLKFKRATEQGKQERVEMQFAECGGGMVQAAILGFFGGRMTFPAGSAGDKGDVEVLGGIDDEQGRLHSYHCQMIMEDEAVGSPITESIKDVPPGALMAATRWPTSFFTQESEQGSEDDEEPEDRRTLAQRRERRTGNEARV